MLKKLLSNDKEHSTLMTAALLFGCVIPMIIYVINNFFNQSISSVSNANYEIYNLISNILNFIYYLSEYLAIATVILGSLKFKFKELFWIAFPIMLGYAIIWIFDLFKNPMTLTQNSSNDTLIIIMNISAVIARILTPLIWAGVAYIVKIFDIKEKAKFLICTAFFVLFLEGINIYNNISYYLKISKGYIDSSLFTTILTGVVVAAIFFLSMFLYEKYFNKICENLNMKNDKKY